MPLRVGFRFLGNFFGRSIALPNFLALQASHQGHSPQAGRLDVQMVAPKSMTACA